MGRSYAPFDNDTRGTPLPDGRGAGVRVCRYSNKRDLPAAALNCEGGPSSLPFSHTGEGFPAPFDGRPRP